MEMAKLTPKKGPKIWSQVLPFYFQQHHSVFMFLASKATLFNVHTVFSETWCDIYVANACNNSKMLGAAKNKSCNTKSQVRVMISSYYQFLWICQPESTSKCTLTCTEPCSRVHPSQIINQVPHKKQERELSAGMFDIAQKMPSVSIRNHNLILDIDQLSLYNQFPKEQPTL